MIYQLRMFACELLLRLIIRIAPKEKQGLQLIQMIYQYCLGIIL